MKTTEAIHQLYEMNNDGERDFSKDKWYSEEEIKKLLNVFIREISESRQHRSEVVEIAKEIFGEEMLDENS